LQKTSEIIFQFKDKSNYFDLHCSLMNHTNKQALLQYRASANFKIQKSTETALRPAPNEVGPRVCRPRPSREAKRRAGSLSLGRALLLNNQ
jgi:hypothetical protein